MSGALDVLRSWFGATSAREVEQAQEALLALSVGAVSRALSAAVTLGSAGARAGAEPAGAALEREERWLREATIPARSVRCTELFGPLGSTTRLERVAHLELRLAIPHPTIDVELCCVPVVPPGLRPPSLGSGVLAIPTIDRIYDDLLRKQVIATHVDGIEVILEALRERSRQALAHLLEGGIEGPWRVWQRSETQFPRPVDLPLEHDPLGHLDDDERDALEETPIALAFCGPEKLAIQYPLVLRYLDCTTSAVGEPFPTRGAELLRPDADGRLLLLAHATSGGPAPASVAEDAIRDARNALAPEHGDSVAGLDDDLAESEWMALRPFWFETRSQSWRYADDELATWFNEVYEESYLTRSDGTFARLDEVIDYPRVSAFTPERAFVWVEDKEQSGGVFRVADAALVGAVRVPELGWQGRPLFSSEGRVGELGEIDEWQEARWEALDDEPECEGALARDADGAWLFYAGGLLWRDTTPLCAFEPPVRVAAFDERGERFAALIGTTLLVIRLAGAELQSLVEL